MDTQRTILAVVLSIIVLLLFDHWMGSGSLTAKHAQSPAAAASSARPSLPPSGLGKPSAAVLSPPGATPGPVLHFSNPSFTGQVSLLGGDIQDLGLRDYKSAVENPTPYQILDSTPSRLTIQQSGFIQSGGQPIQVQFSQAASSVSDSGQRIVLAGKAGPLDVQKTLRFFPGKYLVDETIRVSNRGPAPWSGSYFDQILRNGRTQSHWFMSIFTGAVVMHGSSFTEKGFSDLRGHPELHGGPGWAGMTDHYFLQAIIPEPSAQVQVYARPEGANYAAGVLQPLASLAPGASVTIHQQLYLGPKRQDILANLGHGLEQTVDYGWFTVIAEPMHSVLGWFHGWTGNWGWAIVFLVLAVKLIFFYPSAISYRSMANMRKLQPKLEKIRKEYGDDRQKMGVAMMELYRKEKVSPMAGCLPIVAQMPVFIALYWVLVESVSLRQAPFVLWIHDLAAPDPYFMLPLLMGVSMFVQQRLNPAPVDPIQKRVMSILPVVFAVFFSFFPAGLVVYWLTNNVVSIAQQYLITRHVMKDT